MCARVCLWADSAPGLALAVVKNELAVRPVAFVQVLHDVVRRWCKWLVDIQELQQTWLWLSLCHVRTATEMFIAWVSRAFLWMRLVAPRFCYHTSTILLMTTVNLRYLLWLGTAVAQWLRCCATNRKVAGSIPTGVIGIFHWHKILPIALWPWGWLSL